MSMLSMRALLAADPFLSLETREVISGPSDHARAELVRLGADECEARELLDELIAANREDCSRFGCSC